MVGFSISTLERKKDDIRRLSFDISCFYLSDVRLRNKFLYSEDKQATDYINEFKLGTLSFSEANTKLHEQYKALSDRRFDLMSGKAKLYIIAERRKERNSTLKIALKQVGFIAGSLQLIGGFGICKASLGAACAGLGMPLMVHGSENAWENGYYLLFREDPSKTPLRTAYRQSAKLLGGNHRDADIVFSAVDLSLSTGSMFKYGLKDDAWKLFHYIREDYIIGWRTMSAAGLTSELVGNSATGISLYQLMNDGHSSQWSSLSEE